MTHQLRETLCPAGSWGLGNPEASPPGALPGLPGADQAPQGEVGGGPLLLHRSEDTASPGVGRAGSGQARSWLEGREPVPLSIWDSPTLASTLAGAPAPEARPILGFCSWALFSLNP